MITENNYNIPRDILIESFQINIKNIADRFAVYHSLITRDDIFPLSDKEKLQLRTRVESDISLIDGKLITFLNEHKEKSEDLENMLLQVCDIKSQFEEKVRASVEYFKESITGFSDGELSKTKITDDLLYNVGYLCGKAKSIIIRFINSSNPHLTSDALERSAIPFNAFQQILLLEQYVYPKDALIKKDKFKVLNVLFGKGEFKDAQGRLDLLKKSKKTTIQQKALSVQQNARYEKDIQDLIKKIEHLNIDLDILQSFE